MDDGRGHFFDRHMKPLTGGNTIWTLAVFPGIYEQAAKTAESAAIPNIPGMTGPEWMAGVNAMQGPGLWKKPGESLPVSLSPERVRMLAKQPLPGIRPVPYTPRYAEPYVAAHVIGFVSRNPERVETVYADRLAEGKLSRDSLIGGAGLEKSLDFLLQGREPSALLHYVDASGAPVNGLSLRWRKPSNPFYPLKVVTTLDKDIQTDAENIADRLNMRKGAVVVLDARTSDVLAMVSRPRFDPYEPAPKSENWANLAVKAEIPGSVFKTVTGSGLAGGRSNQAGGHFLLRRGLRAFRICLLETGRTRNVEFSRSLRGLVQYQLCPGLPSDGSGTTGTCRKASGNGRGSRMGIQQRVSP